MSVRSKSNWNLEVLVFKERARKPEYMLRRTSQSKGENQQQTQPTHIWPQHMPGFEPGPRWWEKGALIGGPPFLQINDNSVRTRGV